MERIAETSQPLQGELVVPGDKSISHRAVIFAAIAEGTSRITNLSGGEDNSRTVHAFKEMGVRLWVDGGALHVEGRGWEGLRPPREVIDCGNSGTTMRLLAGVLAGRPFASVLDGDASLRRRPMMRVIEPLEKMGARISSRNGKGLAPLTVEGAALRGVRYASPIASAQVKSAVLLAGLQADGVTEFEEPQKSRDHTEIMAAAFGAPIKVEGTSVSIAGPRRLSGRDIEIPGDLSSAAFFMVAAAAVPGSDVTIRNVGCNPTRGGILDVLQRMGACVTLVRPRRSGGEPVADIQVKGARLKGVEIGADMVARTIDEYPILCIAAALAEGVTTISGAKELRYKESDRIAVMAEGLKRVGVRVEERDDGLTIEGRRGLRGSRIDTHGDHRVAMAFAIAGLCADGGIELDDAKCADISFPGFFQGLESLRSRQK
jgi:3-phosphoshikimate 1-carboxyvinyltransferase